jgi:hypothetical protein
MPLARARPLKSCSHEEKPPADLPQDAAWAGTTASIAQSESSIDSIAIRAGVNRVEIVATVRM